jgi:hypothetical protein
VFWQIRKSEETSSPDDDDDDDDNEDDECVCLLACLCAAIPQQKERQGKKRTTNKKKPNNKQDSNVKSPYLIVCLVCLLFWIFRKTIQKQTPATKQRRKEGLFPLIIINNYLVRSTKSFLLLLII